MMALSPLLFSPVTSGLPLDVVDSSVMYRVGALSIPRIFFNAFWEAE